MLEAIVSVDDVRLRWPDAPSDDERLMSAIMDASAWLIMEAETAGKPYDRDDDVRAACFRIVCCNLVKRAVGVDATGYGVSQTSETAGSYSLQMTYANPDGSYYLTKAERRLLGLDAPKVGFVRMGCINDSRTC